jgi:hypothetical protein
MPEMSQSEIVFRGIIMAFVILVIPTFWPLLVLVTREYKRRLTIKVGMIFVAIFALGLGLIRSMSILSVLGVLVLYVEPLVLAALFLPRRWAAAAIAAWVFLWGTAITLLFVGFEGL